VRTRIVSSALLLALALAACGGSSSKSSSTTSSPSTTASSASTPASAGSDPAAEARAKKLVFVQGDFPAGWTGSPATPDTPEDKATTKQLDTCIGTSGDDAHSADVKGDDFNMGQGTQVSSEAQIIKSDATYKSDVDAIKSPKLQSCLQQFLSKEIAKQAGVTPSSLDLVPFSVPTFGDVTKGMRLTAAMPIQGQTLNIVVDFVLMGKNKAEVTSTFSNVGQPFDQSLEKTLLEKLGAKLDAS
jgi:hypothetical protein